jgi:DNA ligase-1
MASFPNLEATSVLGKTKVWSISVVERDGCGVIITTYGYKDGKKQTNEKIISKGKNIGKTNETTPLQQAISEAQSQWTKKKESDYEPAHADAVVDAVDAVDDASSGGAEDTPSVTASIIPSPMLAHDYHHRGKSIQYPCYVQRKYDGTRCIAIPDKGLFSRNRKIYLNLNHIMEEVAKLPPNIVLDGELYSNTLTFQEIVGIVKRKHAVKYDADDNKRLQIKLHVYDIINYDSPYSVRYPNIKNIINRYKFKYIEPVETEICESEDKMKALHSKYVSEGYEGIILRNMNGLYKNNRSVDLHKYKDFFDDEYEVVDFKEGEGLEEGCVLWICKTKEGKLFNCRPRGSRETRRELFTNGKDYIGKKLTVRFQELTDDKIPRFPVGITFRDYE